MFASLSWALIGGTVLLIAAAAALRWYLAPDATVLSKLQSGQYSLFEVVQHELAKLSANPRPDAPVEFDSRGETIRAPGALVAEGRILIAAGPAISYGPSMHSRP